MEMQNGPRLKNMRVQDFCHFFWVRASKITDLLAQRQRDSVGKKIEGKDWHGIKKIVYGTNWLSEWGLIHSITFRYF
jgi:hypothetical protein